MTAQKCSACNRPLVDTDTNFACCTHAPCVLFQLHLNPHQVAHFERLKATLYAAWTDLDDAATIVDPGEDEETAYEETRGAISQFFPEFAEKE